VLVEVSLAVISIADIVVSSLREKVERRFVFLGSGKPRRVLRKSFYV